MAVRWVADMMTTEHPPCPLWDLPAEIAHEVRVIMPIVNPEPPQKMR